jgi:hypothetical protein
MVFTVSGAPHDLGIGLDEQVNGGPVASGLFEITTLPSSGFTVIAASLLLESEPW